MGDFDETVEARRAERRNQLRPIEVREPARHPQDSAGIEVEVQTSETQSSVLDLSRREALDLIEKLQRHLGETPAMPLPREQYTRHGLQQRLWDKPAERGMSTLRVPRNVTHLLVPHDLVDRIEAVPNPFVMDRS